MAKLISLSLGILIVLSATTSGQQRFEKYQKIEAYEVRPGILMIPRYTVDGEVCEIGLERLNYSPKVIRVASSLSREEILQILDELVPPGERGKPSKDRFDNLITESGQSMTTNIEFDNVSLRVYGSTSTSRRKNETTVNEVVATVTWKNRTCP